MHSLSTWKLAQRPNYVVNVDKAYPYSETPHLGDNPIAKIPTSSDELIQHVDYWGEGRIESDGRTSGFANSYNVNHQYQLVSKGSDRDRKIPNRIPVASYDDCDTSAYIKDNSVITVTVAGEHINSSCAKDIARIVNRDRGQVIAYGFDNTLQEHQNLAAELEKIGLHAFPNADLPSELQDLTLFKAESNEHSEAHEALHARQRRSVGDTHVSFLNADSLRVELYNDVVSGSFCDVTNLARNFKNAMGGQAFSDLVTKLIIRSPRNVMSFAYKLWHNGAKDIVCDNFPSVFHLIFNKDDVSFVNKQYRMGLKLDAHTDSMNDRLAWGDNNLSSYRVVWRIIPVWYNNKVSFKLFNIDCRMYLKLDATPDNIGDRQAWGSTDSSQLRHKYYLEPLYKDGILVFYIINRQYRQGLKLGVSTDSMGDRLLWGHNGNVYNESDRFRWKIMAR